MKIKKTVLMRHFLAFGLMLTILASSSAIVPAATGTNGLSGEIIVSDSIGNDKAPAVLLNGEKALSGRTFFSSGVIATSETASATVNLGKLGHISLSPNSNLNLKFSENNISGSLSTGQIKVFAANGVSVNIQTAGTVENDNGIYTINAEPSAGRQTGAALGGGGRLTAALVFAGIVGAAAVYVLTGEDDDEVTSPVR